MEKYQFGTIDSYIASMEQVKTLKQGDIIWEIIQPIINDGKFIIAHTSILIIDVGVCRNVMPKYNPQAWEFRRNCLEQCGHLDKLMYVYRTENPFTTAHDNGTSFGYAENFDQDTRYAFFSEEDANKAIIILNERYSKDKAWQARQAAECFMMDEIDRMFDNTYDDWDDHFDDEDGYDMYLNEEK